MSREIKFRGFSKELNKWFFGALDNTLNWGDFVITHENGFGIKNRIESDTIGQFTGLKDVNGKEIFEGDTLSSLQGVYDVVYTDGAFYMQRENAYYRFSRVFISHEQIKVIGNIHETKELSNPIPNNRRNKPF